MDVDLLVIGGGVAGASAAIAAADLGASVVLVEKQERLGGSCPFSAGLLVELAGPEALDHLTALAFHTTPDDVLAAYLGGLTTLRERLIGLGASVSDVDRQVVPNCWPLMPGAAGVTNYVVDGGQQAAGSTFGGGRALWQVLERALAGRDVDVRVRTSMTGLVTQAGAVTGADVVDDEGNVERITARAGVVLATGGFENDPALTQAYLPVPLLRPVGNPGNTGDGLRAVQALGASLWHMSAFYGFWAFRAPEWTTAFPLLFFAPGHLIVDGDGRRFHAETGREPHDTMRSIGDYLPHRPNRPQLPAWVVFDEGLLGAGPLCRFPSVTGYAWSEDNAAEVASGWIVEARGTAELAERIGVDAERLAATLTAYNDGARAGHDPDFARPAAMTAPVDERGLFAVQIWPGVATASGGPRRDARARVLREDLSAIPGLYAAGGNGGVWGHLTEHGGGLTDGLVFGEIAARDALGAGRDVAQKPIGSPA